MRAQIVAVPSAGSVEASISATAIDTAAGVITINNDAEVVWAWIDAL